MLVNVVVAGGRVRGQCRLLTDNHEDRRTQVAHVLAPGWRALVHNVVLKAEEPDEFGRRHAHRRTAGGLRSQRLALFAIAALTCSTRRRRRTLDVVSVSRRCWTHRARSSSPSSTSAASHRGAKADGVECDERMRLLEEVTWLKPLADLLEPVFETYRQTHPWLLLDALDPKSVVRDTYEQGILPTSSAATSPPARGSAAALPLRRVPHRDRRCPQCTAAGAGDPSHGWGDRASDRPVAADEWRRC
jgi:hypothetical protein